MQKIEIDEIKNEVWVNGTVKLESVPKDKLDDFVNALVMKMTELKQFQKTT